MQYNLMSASLNRNKKDINVMLISEYHPDSIVSDTPFARKAISGVLEYAGYIEPDLILVDDPNSNILYPELFTEECAGYDPVRDNMDRQFEIAGRFSSDLKKSSPSSDAYLVLTDASWYNIRRLTKAKALSEVTENKNQAKYYENKISDIDKKIKNLKKSGNNNNKEIRQLYAKKGGLTRSINYVEENSLLRMPRRESPEYIAIRDEATRDYLRGLEESCGLPVVPYTLAKEIKGNKLTYQHNPNPSGTASVRKNEFNNIIKDIHKKYTQGIAPPDFTLSSGHHGFTSAHPFRLDKNADYSLVCSGMVMEDQEEIKRLIDGELRGEITQDKHGLYEAVKRQTSSYPSPGIAVVGRDEGCLFSDFYSMSHLAKVGSGELNVDEMDYETIPFLADLHLGKGATNYDSMESALNRINLKEPNLIVNVNETLQGMNYKTMPVETPRKTPRELKEELEKIEDIDELRKCVLDEHLNMNEPVIDNQIAMYDDYMLGLILGTLSRTPYEIGYITTEPTHIFHTVGEYGISEVKIQTRPFGNIDDALELLEENGQIEIKDEGVRNLRNKIKAFNDSGCGYGNLEIKIGDEIYKVSAEHKPGSSTAKSNLPRLALERKESMGDICDIKFEGHLHTPFATVASLYPNEINLELKGMTFNEYDSYGKMGGWSPATVGYMELEIPKNKKGRGVYKVTFVTDDNL
ncbi:MAG: hypothetical protein KAU95_02690 [Candidatus Aenigmarchaeota archaeon]|nr:hypothetical protein [Candidatus Aenigmarchaeota archaeon]